MFDHLPNGIELPIVVHNTCLLSVITIMVIDPLADNASIQLRLYDYS